MEIIAIWVRVKSRKIEDEINIWRISRSLQKRSMRISVCVHTRTYIHTFIQQTTETPLT